MAPASLAALLPGAGAADVSLSIVFAERLLSETTIGNNPGRRVRVFASGFSTIPQNKIANRGWRKGRSSRLAGKLTA